MQYLGLQSMKLRRAYHLGVPEFLEAGQLPHHVRPSPGLLGWSGGGAHAHAHAHARARARAREHAHTHTHTHTRYLLSLAE